MTMHFQYYNSPGLEHWVQKSIKANDWRYLKISVLS